MDSKIATLREWKDLIKDIGIFGLIAGIILVYGPENLFNLSRKILSLFGIKAKISIKRIFAWMVEDGSEAAKLLNTQVRVAANILAKVINRSLLVIVVFFVLLTVGVAIQSRVFIAILGLVTFLYFFTIVFAIEKAIMMVGAVYDVGAKTISGVGSLAKSSARMLGIEIEEKSDNTYKERLRDSFKELRFVPFPFAALASWLALLPFWETYGVAFIVTCLSLGLAQLNYWKNNQWISRTWHHYRRVTIFAMVFLLLLFAAYLPARYAFPKSYNSVFGDEQSLKTETDKKLSEEIARFWEEKKEKKTTFVLDNKTAARMLGKTHRQEKPIELEKPPGLVKKLVAPVQIARARPIGPAPERRLSPPARVSSQAGDDALSRAAEEALRIKEEMKKELEALEGTAELKTKETKPPKRAELSFNPPPPKPTRSVIPRRIKIPKWLNE